MSGPLSVDAKIVQLSSGKKLFVDVMDEKAGKDAPAIFFMHGLGSNTSFWDASLSSSSLLDKYRLIRYDFDGHGLSPVSTTASAAEGDMLSIDDLVEDLAAVMEYVGVEKAAGVVGHSMSGMVANKFAATFPDKVDKLVLLGAMRALNPTVQSVMLKRASTVQSSGLSSVVDGVVSAALSDHTKQSSPLSAALVRSLVLAASPAGYAAACHALAAAQDPDYAAITAPTLIVAGEHDYMSNSETAAFFEERIEGAKRVEMKNVGHWHAVEQPLELRRILEKWFSPS
ncbi:hypothetical protein JCM6882_006062 [Rhodosporidiobolus microsporus]